MDNPCPTVMVVDDEAEVREFARYVLENQGFQVLVAKNGVEALLLGEHHAGSIQALITDLIMPPYMGGCELAQALRRVRPGLAVLYISGYPADAIVQGEVMEESAGFLAKPFMPDVLIRRVQELIQSARKPSISVKAKLSGRKPDNVVLLLVPDADLRGGVASLLRMENLRVLEAGNIGEALAACQWHSSYISLLLADRDTLASLPLELSERLTQARPEMRVLCASASAAGGQTVSDRIRRAIEEWGLEVADED